MNTSTPRRTTPRDNRVNSRQDEIEAAWTANLAARSKAEASGKIADGIAAGRAWGRWLDLFNAKAA